MQINESEQKIQNEINKLEIIDGKKRTFDQMEKDDTLSIEKLKIDNFSRFYVKFNSINGAVIEPHLYHGYFAEQFDMQLIK